MDVTNIKLNSGFTMPVVGFGTYFGKKQSYETEAAVKCIESALEAGYRHLDTAVIYGTEKLVGRAIANQIKDGRLKREDVFITTKLPFNAHNASQVMSTVENSLQALGMDYIDLYLIHSPMAISNTDTFSNELDIDNTNDHLTTWKALEDCVKRGYLRSIGLSNFNSKQVQNILDNCYIKPVTNQVEVHPYFANLDLVKYCQERNVVVTAYTPLGQPNASWCPPTWTSPLADPVLNSIAATHDKSAAQIALKFQLQRGLVVVAKASSEKRIKENVELFDFELTSDEMLLIRNLDKNARANTFKSFAEHKDYPFSDDI